MRKSLAVAVAVSMVSCSRPPPAPVQVELPDPPPIDEAAAAAAETTVGKKSRAVTVTAAAGSWLRAGVHVDVVGTFVDPQTKEDVAVTLLQNVIVSSVEPGTAGDQARAALLVIPEEVELLTLAQRLGGLTLSLRAEDDLDILEERGRATVNTLMSGERSRVLQQKRFNTIQVIRGSSGGGGSVATGPGWGAGATIPVRRDDPAPVQANGSPNGVPDMFLKSYGVNPTLDVAAEPVSTFAADVDTGSYTLARAWLGRGELPNEAAIRVEEFVNAFDYGYRPPETEAFAVQVEAFPSPTRPGFHVMHVGVQGKKLAKGERKPANLVFTLDVSGSMDAENRLGLAKQALAILVRKLEEKDSVALVVYGSDARVVLPPTNASQKARILEAIDGLRTDGSTNVQAGLELAYAVALKAFKPNGINRVVLCSDGVANNGVTDADGIFAKVKSKASEGITLSTVGFGMGNYNDVLMERLADQGDGNYAYVDALPAAKKIFDEQIEGTLEVIAKDLKLQLEFDPAAVSRYRLIGFENRKLAKHEFANDKVDAGDVGAGHAVTAIYEVKLADRNAPTLATFRARFKAPGTHASALVERAIPMAVVHDEPQGATGPARLGVVVATFAEKLRGSYWMRQVSWDRLEAMFAELPPAERGRPDAVELKQLIATAKKLDRRDAVRASK